MAMIETPDPAQQLAARLADAVHKAVLDHALSIAQGTGSCRSLHVEVELRKDGQVTDVAFWTEFRLSPGEMVGLVGKSSRRY